MPLRADLASLHTWGFDDPGPLRDELTALALSGAKTTTASLVIDFEMEGEALPKAGQRDVLVEDTPVVLERFRIVERLDPGEAG
jgi:uncharacterized protein YhfF